MGPARSFSIAFPPDLFEAITAYMAQEQVEKPAEAVRMLCRIALAADPSTGAEIASRARAWNETRCWAQTRLAQALMEINRELQMSMQSTEGQQP